MNLTDETSLNLRLIHGIFQDN